MATIALALVEFIGIFLVFLLQHNRDMILYHFADVNRLTEKLTEAFVSIKEPDINKITTALYYIKDKIKMLDKEIELLQKSEQSDIVKIAIAHKVEDFKILKELEYILEELILKRIKLENDFEPHNKSFIFAIFSIFLFMIPIALNHINYSNDNFSRVFENWNFFKMPFA